jgi:hypothetical protein
MKILKDENIITKIPAIIPGALDFLCQHYNLYFIVSWKNNKTQQDVSLYHGRILNCVKQLLICLAANKKL